MDQPRASSAAALLTSAFDLADILNPSSAAKRLPTMDYANTATASHFHPDLDHGLGFHPLHPAHPHSSPFDHPDSAVDLADHSSYDFFSPNPTNPSHQHPSSHPLFGSRYRTNASSSSSLGPHSLGAGQDSLFGSSHPPSSAFPDAVSSYGASPAAAHPFDLMSGYSNSGKVSPLTPHDSVLGMGFHGGKEFSSPPYGDLVADRRPSNLSTGSFQSEFHDDYGTSNPLALGSFQQNQQQQQQQQQQSQTPTGPHFDGRLGRFSHPDPSFPTHPTHAQVAQRLQQQASLDMMRAQHAFRADVPSPYDELGSHFSLSPPADLSMRLASGGPGGMMVDEPLSRMKLAPGTDLQSFVRPYLEQYVRSNNRLAFGERSVIVMSSKVAQKSYGTEKRFLCPPPTAIMLGNSWWSEAVRRGEEPKVAPPRVVISISGEPVPQEGSIEWTSTSGKAFDVADPPTGTTFIGRCVGKQLFISDINEKMKKVEALVKIMAPASDDEPERVIGVFPSRPIKVISKPSKKRQSAKNLELCINHGSTISLFHRLRSQTVSTKYLCVSGSGSSFKGSDGQPLIGLDNRSRTTTPSFIARTASWDPFVMYIVDINKPPAGMDQPPPPPPQPEYPSPPPNAIPFTNNGSPIPVYYNQTVVLQCLTSGVVSPVLIIRKVDHGTTVVGGGLQEGAKGVADHFCAPGEVCGDPVSQLHKIAFEVYDAGKGAPEPGTPGMTGAFLSCMGEKVNTYRPVDGRQWNSPPPTSSGSPRASGSPVLSGSPIISTPASVGNGSSNGGSNGVDYFGGSGNVSPNSTPPSPSTLEFPSNDGGRVKKGKRGTSSAGGVSSVSKSGSGSGSVTKGRRRQNSAGSTTSSSRHGSSGSGSGEQVACSGALWQVDIGETSVWTIVGTDQIRYNFYVPPVLYDQQQQHPHHHPHHHFGGFHMNGHTGSNSFPIPSKPVTPFPGVVKYLPPDRAAEAPKGPCPSSRGTAAALKPNPHASKMLTLYGENFSKTDPVTVFFGSDPSPYVEVRCQEVVGCLPPDSQSTKRRPIVLVRGDGVVFPSNTMYP